MVQRKDYDNLSHLNFNWIKHSNLFRYAISTWEYSHYNLLEMKGLPPTKEEFGREKFDSPSSHSATSFPRSLVLVHSLPQYLTFTHFARAYFFNFYERRQVKIPAGEMLTMKRLANRIPRIRDAGRATRRDATEGWDAAWNVTRLIECNASRGLGDWDGWQEDGDGKGDRRMCWTREGAASHSISVADFEVPIPSAVQQWSLFCRRKRGYRCWTSIDWKRSMRLLA